MTRERDLSRVRREGKRIRTGRLEVRVVASPSSSTRAGVIVPRFKHSAVDRNQLKRRLKELIRLRVLPRVQGADLVVRISPPAYDASFAELAAEIDRAVRQLPRILERLREESAATPHPDAAVPTADGTAPAEPPADSADEQH